ncbi:telomerase-binding protein EST1A-like isoform X2 [Microplitis mediator]|uniref:telomerase-binding protein EST1A-like isoform X2 n=1 Tax=Microplitis mediator TaxID=375433 RepID=UPI002554B3CE|nr:telomerase-binding protein EST1A-like isoform X2 [Microplitis mediator]
MATHDKGRRKWIDNSQDNYNSNFDKNKLMGGRRGFNRGPQQIYTPGSGPLKKSDRQDEYEYEGSSPKSSVQDRLKRPFNNINLNNSSDNSHNSVNMLADKLNDVHVNRSRQFINDRHYDKSVNSQHADLDRRRNKKPEQQLYVPKKIHESINEPDTRPVTWEREKDQDKRDWETQSNRSRNDSRNRPSRQSSVSSADKNMDKNSRNKDGKRYTGRVNRDKDDKDSWRPESPVNKNYNRSTRDHRRRQGSEPPDDYMYRNRDTRSVDPGMDKYPRKPPTGRRNPKMNALKIESLPPRLQRKYFEENGIEPPVSHHNGEPWESVMPNYNNYYSSMPPQMINLPAPIPGPGHGFGGNSGGVPVGPGPGSGSGPGPLMGSIPNPVMSIGVNPNGPGPGAYGSQQWSNTLPARSRGRGRFRPEELDVPNYRPGTPDQYSAPSTRSHTPSQEVMTRSYDRRGSNSTMYTSMESLSRADSILMPPPLSPASYRNQSEGNRRKPSPTNKNSYSSRSNNTNEINTERNNYHSPSKTEPSSLSDMPSETLDWSEEVELSEKLENERLSRSSSVMSFNDNASIGNQAGVKRTRSKKKKRERKRTGDLDDSLDHDHRNDRQSSRERKNNQYNRENSNSNNNYSNNRRFDRRRRESSSRDEENWRTGKRVSICESEDGKSVSSVSAGHALTSEPNSLLSISPMKNNVQQPGVLVLPEAPPQSPPYNKDARFNQRKTLFDPNNPNKPIVVPSPGSRASIPAETSPPKLASHRAPSQFQQSLQLDGVPPQYVADQINNARPIWYDVCSDNLKNAVLLRGIETVDRELEWLLTSGGLTANWDRVAFLRQSLQQSLQTLLETDIKFCQAENVEQHFWKILFYNIIEMLRKIMPKEGPEGREVCKKIMLKIIDDGTVYFENLLTLLENTYKFKLEVFLSSAAPPKGLGFVGLALVSAQKIFLFLGDLARYKEQANETTNYGKSRQWYLKAQQINPKNGRPYNQLALLAHYARRKLDAVYFYMRSLMASNPFHSARESLIALFDENRKKYESTERKRKEEREWKERARMKEKEGANNIAGGLRRETWIHPGGRRMRRTTSTASASENKLPPSDLEDLAQLSSVEVNKRFVTSYLHVHGKLITKIGMETFQEAGVQMLREFRALLQHSPLPLPGTRLLQLLALNMFAIETTQLKDSQMEQGYRSEVQERALVVSLQMFNLILERSVALLREELDKKEKERPRLIVDEDMQVLLPTIKIWCDWMLCHSTVWNPPPSCTDYRVGPLGDAWSRLATMVNLLEKLPYPRKIVIHAREAIGRENELNLVKLPEDATLSGFTPLMSNPQDSFYAEKTEDMEVAQVCLRIQKILFFGQVFLCGLETPVLKLQKNEFGISEYVSLVETSSTSSPNSPPEQSDSELLVDSYSEGEEEPTSLLKRLSNDSLAESEIRLLIERKEELERRQRKQERHRQRVQAILQKSSVSVEIEVRPRQLVPDTNCFIDYLPQLQRIAKTTSGPHPLFTLMIPLVVLNELEGLARGADARDCPPSSRSSLDPEHIARVADSAKAALAFARSKNPAIRCLTTRGTVLTSSIFTVEDDVRLNELASNDDRILATCLSLCRTKDLVPADEGQPRRLRRDVVLLTEDRNLRVKALARDVPVREVPDFMLWAGLG